MTQLSLYAKVCHYARIKVLIPVSYQSFRFLILSIEVKFNNFMENVYTHVTQLVAYTIHTKNLLN